nr:acyltransferase [Myxococcus sp. AM010]
MFHFAAPCLGTAPEALRDWAGAGYAAVGVFFVLSGFVLAWNYLDADGRMATSPRAFWAARVARVYPVYALTFLLSAPTTIAASVADNGWKVASAKLAVGGAVTLALLQAWVPRLALYWNPPGWSVAVEACFYGLFPRLAKGLPRLNPAWLPVALGGAWVLGLLPPLLYLALSPDGPGPVDVQASGPWLMALKFNPLARLPEFLFGVLLGWCFVRERAAGGVKGSGAVLAALGAALLVAAGAAGARVPYPLMHNALLAPASGLLVYGLARGRRRPGLAAVTSHAGEAGGRQLRALPAPVPGVGGGQGPGDVAGALGGAAHAGGAAGHRVAAGRARVAVGAPRRGDTAALTRPRRAHALGGRCAARAREAGGVWALSGGLAPSSETGGVRGTCARSLRTRGGPQREMPQARLPSSVSMARQSQPSRRSSHTASSSAVGSTRFSSWAARRRHSSFSTELMEQSHSFSDSSRQAPLQPVRPDRAEQRRAAVTMKRRMAAANMPEGPLDASWLRALRAWADARVARLLHTWGKRHTCCHSSPLRCWPPRPLRRPTRS